VAGAHIPPKASVHARALQVCTMRVVAAALVATLWYSLDPPLRKLHVKKTGVGHKPGGLKKKAAPWQAPCSANTADDEHAFRGSESPSVYEYMYPFWMCCPLVTTRAW